MFARFSRRVLLACTVLSCQAVVADDPMDSERKERTEPEAKVSRRDWSSAQLTAALASKNKPPLIRKDGPPSGLLGSVNLISNDYDPARQDVVYECLGELMTRGVDAIPALVDHLDDQRYSLTVYYPPGYLFRNHRVRQVCWNALGLLLEPGLSLGVTGAVAEDPQLSYCRQVLRDRTGAKRWLATHQALSLSSLQIESLVWLQHQPGYRRLPAEEQQRLTQLLSELRKSGQSVAADVRGFAPNSILYVLSFAVSELELADGGRICCWYDPISDSGVLVVRLDKLDREIWRHMCQDFGGLHSEYTHKVAARVDGSRVQVASAGSFGQIIETLDLATGRQLQRKKTAAR